MFTVRKFANKHRKGDSLLSRPASMAPVTPEVLVPRLGDSLVEKGLLSPQQLKQALTHQKSRADEGHPILLGEALTQLGFIDRQKLDEAVTEQIAQLQQALQKSNQSLEKRVEERTLELQDALDKLTELNRLKNDFISNISHELRTPLAHMIGYVDLLADASLGPLSEEQDQAIQVLQKSNRRLNSLIDNLLFLSFDTQESMQLEIGPVSLHTVLPSLTQQLKDKAANQSISLDYQIEGSTPSVLADPDKIEWALIQLIDNAIKFNQPQGQVLLSAVRNGRRVELAVADTGIGIPADKLDNALEPFSQLDGSSTRKYGGAGIGLTLAKRIIEAHGAKLKIESWVGKGTRVSFSLAIAEGHP
jgi:signal transduction histidine kinase